MYKSSNCVPLLVCILPLIGFSVSCAPDQPALQEEGQEEPELEPPPQPDDTQTREEVG